MQSPQVISLWVSYQRAWAIAVRSYMFNFNLGSLVGSIAMRSAVCAGGPR
jgi:hypothetical protein